jgi:putative lumazine-binding protein
MEVGSESTDVAAIVATARDYFEGWFDADEERMARALAPDFVKRRAGEQLGITTKERMLELTRQGEGTRDGTDRTLDIWVHDVYDSTATATVHSVVYHEHLHLVRTTEGWKIANALWQFT